MSNESYTNENIVKAVHNAEFLVADLRELAKTNDGMLHILAMQQLEAAAKIVQVMNQISAARKLDF